MFPKQHSPVKLPKRSELFRKMSENGHDQHYFEFVDFRLYPAERLLTKNGDRIALTPRVLDLLIALVERSGELLSKEALLNEVWADSFVEEGNLNRTISTLRKNLGNQSNGGNLIETVPKLGYRFIAPVTQISRARTEQAPVIEISQAEAKKALAAKGRRGSLIGLAAAAVVILLGG